MKILVTVASGLVLAALLYVSRHWIPPAFRWLMGVFGAAWSWLVSSHAIPGWLLLSLSLCGVWCFFCIIAKFRSPPTPAEPHQRDFAEFEFLGVLWRWHYDSYGAIHSLVSFCPVPLCDMQTYGRPGRYFGPSSQATTYPCERCGHTAEIDGSQEAIESRVIREIQRFLRSDEWKKYIRPSA